MRLIKYRNLESLPIYNWSYAVPCLFQTCTNNRMLQYVRLTVHSLWTHHKIRVAGLAERNSENCDAHAAVTIQASQFRNDERKKAQKRPSQHQGFSRSKSSVKCGIPIKRRKGPMRVRFQHGQKDFTSVKCKKNGSHYLEHKRPRQKR